MVALARPVEQGSLPLVHQTQHVHDSRKLNGGPPHSVCRFPGQQADPFAPRGETWLPFPPRSEHVIERARGQEGLRGVGGWVRTSCGDRQTQTVLNKHNERQGLCPWRPPQGGARDQSSLRAGACRPREKRARPITGLAPALTLTTPCPVLGALLRALLSLRREVALETTVQKRQSWLTGKL